MSEVKFFVVADVVSVLCIQSCMCSMSVVGHVRCIYVTAQSYFVQCIFVIVSRVRDCNWMVRSQKEGAATVIRLAIGL